MILQPVGRDDTGQIRIAGPLDTVRAVNVVGQGGCPTLTLGATAVVGIGASASIEGTNRSGKITFTTGLTLLQMGKVLTMTFADGFSFPTTSYPVFTPGNANFAGVMGRLYVEAYADRVDLLVTASLLSLGMTYVGYYNITGR